MEMKSIAATGSLGVTGVMGLKYEPIKILTNDLLQNLVPEVSLEHEEGLRWEDEDTCILDGCIEDRFGWNGLCKRHYGQQHVGNMSMEDLVLMWDPECRFQNCNNPARYLDHDHACCDNVKVRCGKCNRGFLCNGCNTALGTYEKKLAEGGGGMAGLRRPWLCQMYLDASPHYPGLPTYE